MSGEWNERLSVPWTWHLGMLTAIGLLGAEIAQVLPPALAALPFVVLLALGEMLLWHGGSSRIRVSGGAIEVGDWRLPLERVRSVEPLQGPAARAVLRTPDHDDYRLIRGWIRGLVRLEVDDPDDRPVWLFSTRSPDGLTAALVAARGAPSASPPHQRLIRTPPPMPPPPTPPPTSQDEVLGPPDAPVTTPTG